MNLLSSRALYISVFNLGKYLEENFGTEIKRHLTLEFEEHRETFGLYVRYSNSLIEYTPGPDREKLTVLSMTHNSWAGFIKRILISENILMKDKEFISELKISKTMLEIKVGNNE